MAEIRKAGLQPAWMCTAGRRSDTGRAMQGNELAGTSDQDPSSGQGVTSVEELPKPKIELIEPGTDPTIPAREAGAARGQHGPKRATGGTEDGTDAETSERWIARLLGRWAVPVPLVAGLLQPALINVGVLLYLVLWNARLVSHIDAGYLRWPTRRHMDQLGLYIGRRGHRIKLLLSTLWEFVGVAALVAVLWLRHSAGNLQWLRVALLVVASIVVTAVPIAQGRLTPLAKIQTGGQQVRHRLRHYLQGSWIPLWPLIRLVKWATSRKPRARFGALSESIAIGLPMLVVAMVLSLARDDSGDGQHPHAAPAVVRMTITRTIAAPPQPQPTATATVTLIPQPPSETNLRYDEYCRYSQGGPVPAVDAPSWAQSALYAMYLGNGQQPGAGGVKAGCAGTTHVTLDRYRLSAWTIGTSPVTGQTLSVAAYSADTGSCLIIGTPATNVAALLQRGLTIGCVGMHDFGSNGGDAYLIETGSGTYAYVRADPKSDYLELPPGVSDIWAGAEVSAHQVLIPVKTSPTTYEFRKVGGQVVDQRVDVRGAKVWLVSRAGSVEMTARAQLSWGNTPY